MSGPSIYCLAGWGQPRESFDPLRDYLETHLGISVERWTSTSVTSLFATDRDPVAELLLQIPLGSVLIGWSLGGMIALEAALREEERISALVLIGCTARFLEANDHPGTSVPSLAALVSRVERDPESALSRFSKLVWGAWAPAPTRDGIETILTTSPSKSELLAGLHHLERYDVRGSLLTSRIPVLLLHGERDRVVSRECAASLAQVIPHAEHHTLQDGEHALPLGATEWVGRQTVTFLRPLLEGTSPSADRSRSRRSPRGTSDGSELHNAAAYRSVQRRFSRAVLAYDREASAQRNIATETARIVPPLSAQRILELGCGTGFLTAHLLGSFPEARIVAVDISSEMIDLCRARFGESRITFCAENFFALENMGQFDLITSSSTIQWLAPLTTVFERITTWLRPGGHAILSTLVDGTLLEVRDARRVLGLGERAKLPPMETIRAAAIESGLIVEWVGTREFSEYYPDGETLIRAISRSGFTGRHPDDAAPSDHHTRELQVLRRSQLQQLSALLTAQRTPHGVRATYRAAFFRMRKPRSADGTVPTGGRLNDEGLTVELRYQARYRAGAGSPQY